METKLDIIKNFLSKKLVKLSKDLESIRAEENNEEMCDNVSYQFYITKAQFERKCKTMLLYIEYEKLISLINECTEKDAITHIKEEFARLKYFLLNCKLSQSSSCPITSITSFWETEMQQRTLQDLDKLLAKIGER